MDERDIAARADQGGRNLDQIFMHFLTSTDIQRDVDATNRINELRDVIIKSLSAERVYNNEEVGQIRRLIQGYVNSDYDEANIETIVKYIESLN